MNPGTLRISIKSAERSLQGLHVCTSCANRIGHAFNNALTHIILASPTRWTGPCDLCRIAATKSERGPADVR